MCRKRAIMAIKNVTVFEDQQLYILIEMTCNKKKINKKKNG